FEQMGDWEKMHREQINATRLIKQLKALLYEMDMLRNQVQESDLKKFDKLTDDARNSAQDAIKEYLVLNPQGLKPVWIMSRRESSTCRTEGKESETQEDQTSELQLQMSKSTSFEELAKQVECAKSWENLQAEVQDVHQLFEDLSLIVKEQKEKVDDIEDNVEVSAENVKEGTKNLARAARYKTAIYPIAGAVLGGCLGGPVGLMAGFKLGGLAAIGCGVIGFTGGQLLKKKQQLHDKNNMELVDVKETSNIKGSVSLPLICDVHTNHLPDGL
ncbi:hypothetical protein L9F63_009229, partial [Diploptera punctata]